MKYNTIRKNFNSILKEKDIKNLLTNFISLVILQGLNVLLPFLTIPYLISVVGLELFGLITFSYSLAFFFQSITEYGFNTITSREISIYSNDHSKLKELFTDVFTTKMLLVFLLFIIYLIVVFSVPEFSKNSSIYIFQYGCVLGQAIFPIWLFHGLQKMKYITYVNIIFKSIFTIAIFILVKTKEDFWIAPICTALGLITSGLASLIVCYFQFKIKFVKTNFTRIKKQLKAGYYVFLSELQIAAIVNGNTLILGFFAGNEAVGIFTAAEKIIKAIGNLQTPIINTLYPYIAKKMNNNKTKAIQSLKKIKLYIITLITLGILILFIGADLFFKIIYGAGFEQSILIFRILLLFPLLSFLDQYYGKLILLTNHQEKNYMRVFLITSITSVLLSCLLCYKYNYVGLALSTIIIQGFIAYGMYHYTKKIL